jgi:replication factor A1
MLISDLKANQPIDFIVLEIVNPGEAKEFTNFRGQVRVANAKVKDETGECSLTLWNDDAGKFSKGQKIKITNGWCKEYRGEIQVSSGKYGRIEVIGDDGKVIETPHRPEDKKPSSLENAGKPKKRGRPKKTMDEDEENVSEPEEDIFSEAEKKDPYLKYEKMYGKGKA